MAKAMAAETAHRLLTDLAVGGRDGFQTSISQVRGLGDYILDVGKRHA